MTAYKSLGLVGLAIAGLFATEAYATPTCPTGTMGAPACIATSPTNGQASLQDILSQKSASNPSGIVSKGPNINPYTQQLTPSSKWAIGASGASENRLVIKMASNPGDITFGMFDPNNVSNGLNSGNSLELFQGSAGQGWSTNLLQSGNTYTAQYSNEANQPTGTDTVTFGSGMFGYYITDGSNTFYSVPSMNEVGDSVYPNGTPHMVAYAGNGKTTLTYDNGKQSGLFLRNEYLLAWDGQPFSDSSLDYNDFMVLVESVHPVPEPAVLGMFGFGLLLVGGFVTLRRRQVKA